jgi:hypothetical protein
MMSCCLNCVDVPSDGRAFKAHVIERNGIGCCHSFRDDDCVDTKAACVQVGHCSGPKSAQTAAALRCAAFVDLERLKHQKS